MAKRIGKGGPIWMERDLLASDAFRTLSRTAIVVLMDFYCKRVMVKLKSRKRSDVWVVENNGDITYTYKEAESRGISIPAFRDAIDRLIKHGFLDIEESGAGVHRMTTRYSLSERWRKYGTDEFVQKKRRKARALGRNIGFRSGHPYYPRKK